MATHGQLFLTLDALYRSNFTQILGISLFKSVPILSDGLGQSLKTPYLVSAFRCSFIPFSRGSTVIQLSHSCSIRT